MTFTSFYKYDLFVTECDCGDDGTCTFNTAGTKQCNCPKDYAEKDGKCESKIFYSSEILEGKKIPSHNQTIIIITNEPNCCIFIYLVFTVVN